MTKSETLPSLPESWVWTKLVESCQYLPTGIENFKGQIEYYSTSSIQDGHYIPEGIFSFLERPSRANRMAQKGDIIQARMANTNKALLINEELNGKLISTGFIQLRPLNCCKSMSYYVFYFFQSPDFFKQRDALATGSTQVALTDNGAKNINFPLPPLSEQHRIVSRIDELFTNLDAGIKALKKSQAQLKRYRQSVLKSACEGKLVPTEAELARAEGRNYEPAEVLLKRILKERRRKWEELNKGKKYKEPATLDASGLLELPEGWIWTISDAIFWFVTSGSRGWAKYYSETGPIFLRVGNLDHDSISLDLNNIQRVQPPAGTEGLRTRIIAGDVLISITADVGMIALAPNDIEEAYINQHVSLARPVSANNPHYLAWFLANRDGGQKQFIQLQRGATKKGLGLDDICSINIPLPPLSEQHRIVAEVERRLSVADEMEKTIEQSLKQAERLHHSILKRAFEGKLVLQDPEDEPASVLLERIKAEKAKRDAEKKAKKRRITRNIKMMEVTKETKKVIKVEGLYDILLSSKKTMTPKELWQLSKLDIEEFYAQLKVEVEKGRVMESRPNDSDVYLEIGK